MIESFLAARRVSTPLIMIRTPDPSITRRVVIESGGTDLDKKNKKDGKPIPLLTWNCILGTVGINDAGKEAIAEAIGTSDADDIKNKTTNCTEALEWAQKLPSGSILFFENAHMGFDPPNPNFIQAACLLRDSFKRDRRQLVILTPGCQLPPELAQDVYVLDEPLPNQEQLGSIIDKCFEAASGEITPELRAKAVDSICGLAAFPAEQVTSMSMFKKCSECDQVIPPGEKCKCKKSSPVLSINLDRMWERKRQIVESTPGLSVYRGTEKFDDIGGLENIKKFLRLFIGGKRRPRVVLFMDEIEKMVAGQQDTSGTSQALTGKFLSWSQGRNGNNHVKVNGALLLGHAGVGKSILCKALGNEAGVPTIMWDLGSVKSSLVGSSEARMDQALKVIDAIGNGEILMVASCNKVEALSPEFKSRFQLSTWFFDLPTAEERATIWDLHRKRFEIDPNDPKPDDEGWVGREIESCCQGSYLLNIPLVEAAKYIAPSWIANQEAIEKLRSAASGRYLSASYPGPYKHINSASDTASGASRAIEV